MVEKQGVAGYASDYVESSRVVKDRPTDGHVHAYSMPVEPGEDGPQYDVVVRGTNEGDGWPVRESFGGFESAREAAEFAAEKADEVDEPLWDSIESLEHSAAVHERLRDADDDQ